MSGLGSLITSFQGDPTFRTLDNVKDPALQRQINDARGGAGALNAQSNQALGDYITKYLGGIKDAESRTGQEMGTIDQFFNGGYANQLAQLRASRGQAMTQAADVATQQAMRGLNQGRLGEQGAGSSYDSRMAIGAMQPIRVQAALDNATQARSDMGGLTSLQLGTMGQRQGMADNQAAYGLKPIGVSQSLYQNNLSNLNGISSLDNSNNIYGVQQKTTDLDKWGKFLNNSWNSAVGTAGAVSSAYGGLSGMGGGGGGGGGGGSSM